MITAGYGQEVVVGMDLPAAGPSAGRHLQALLTDALDLLEHRAGCAGPAGPDHTPRFEVGYVGGVAHDETCASPRWSRSSAPQPLDRARLAAA